MGRGGGGGGGGGGGAPPAGGGFIGAPGAEPMHIWFSTPAPAGPRASPARPLSSPSMLPPRRQVFYESLLARALSAGR